ncbi:MAG: proline dehydrogenase family protein [Ferruginibacter sp.]
MNTNTAVSFDNTEIAFAGKKDAALKKARILFSVMGKQWVVNLGLKLTPVAIKWKIPFTNAIIRETIFQQFVGGETLEETSAVAKELGQYNVQVILDYGVEGGDNGEQGFDHSTKEFMRVIDYAATQPNIPFMSVKVTGFSRFTLLEKIDRLMNGLTGTLMKRYLSALDLLPQQEKEEWHQVRVRMLRICETAAEKNVRVLVDAEETWIQDPVDALTILMMDTFNKGRAVVYNTLQLYRTDRLKFLKDSYEAAFERDFILGAKLVRGAYMENERKRAAELNYPSPIQPEKVSCDKEYNAAVEFSINHLDKIALVVASHNEKSNLYTTQLLDQKGLPHDHPNVHFSQLYGMSDNITFNLAGAGFSVSKYLPFGPIKDVIPYLMRRAEENSSMSGQTGKELRYIQQEIKRRQTADFR